MQSFEIIGEIAEIETNCLYPAEYFVLVVLPPKTTRALNASFSAATT